MHLRRNPISFAFSGSRHEPEPKGRSDHDQWQFGASGFEPERLGQVQLRGYELRGSCVLKHRPIGHQM